MPIKRGPQTPPPPGGEDLLLVSPFPAEGKKRGGWNSTYNFGRLPRLSPIGSRLDTGASVLMNDAAVVCMARGMNPGQPGRGKTGAWMSMSQGSRQMCMQMSMFGDRGR